MAGRVNREIADVAPSSLTMRLFAPGMTLLHRAGLGGLASTLQALESARVRGRLKERDLPGGKWKDGPPWTIDRHSITLNFGKPENAAEYLKRLFAFGFQTRKDGLISLPGQYDEGEPSQAIMADLQSGLTLTFLQHGKVRQLAKEPTTTTHDPEDTSIPGVVVEYRRCEGFKHQKGWEQLVDNKGRLVAGGQRVDGPLNPGAVVRHVAFTAGTAAEDPPERLLPLYFAIVGCLALPVNRGVAALIVPEVDDLLNFAALRGMMTPRSPKSSQVANAADGVLQTQIRILSKRRISDYKLPGCYAMTFMPTAWASQQKSRVATIHVPPGDERLLKRFQQALICLPTRIVARTVTETAGRGRKKRETVRQESFRSDSIVRPLVAENLASARPWYAGFIRLMTARDQNGKLLRDRLPFERKGLQEMTNDPQFWDHAGEETVVRAVHEALRSRYGQIASENENKPGTMKNRFAGEYDRWRLAFSGAKTADQFRKALCDLFSRGGQSPVLQAGWRSILPMLDGTRWQLARDLALLALASYASRGDAPDRTDSTKTSKTAN